jgi:monoamine oxidase
MRFNASMLELTKLINALQLSEDVQIFPMVDPSQNNRRRFRGESFTVSSEVAGGEAIWETLYRLHDDEKGIAPADLLQAALNRVLAANGVNPPPSQTPAFWQALRTKYTWKGATLNQWQLWALLRDMGHGEEAITMMSQALGFTAPMLDLVNAGSALQLLADFPARPTFYTLRRGYGKVTDALAANVSALGGEIRLASPVTSLTRLDQGFAVDVQDAGGASSRYVAPQVILTPAAAPMRRLYDRAPALNTGAHAAQLRADIDSVRGMPLLKILFYYDHPWWDDASIVQPPYEVGVSFTDLPINAVYPFLSITEPQVSSHAALTIYCDFAKVNYWRGLQNVPPAFTSDLQTQHPEITPTTTAIVDAVSAQLTELMGANAVPAPLLSCYRCWADDGPVGSAYHMWALGADDVAAGQRLVEPTNGLYVANEAWSDMQGWVNGSLRSSDLVLSKFGVTPMAVDPAFPPCMLPLEPSLT